MRVCAIMGFSPESCRCLLSFGRLASRYWDFLCLAFLWLLGVGCGWSLLLCLCEAMLSKDFFELVMCAHEEVCREARRECSVPRELRERQLRAV